MEEVTDFVRRAANGADGLAKQVAALDDILRSLLEGIIALRNKSDKLNLVLHHKKNSNELTLLKVKLTKFLKFMKEKVFTKTGTTTRRRNVIEQLRRKLEILEGDLCKLADDIYVVANQASSDKMRSIVKVVALIVPIIGALCSMNPTAMAMTAGAGISVACYAYYSAGVSETEIEFLINDLQTSRKQLAEHLTDLDRLLWSDTLEWSDHDD